MLVPQAAKADPTASGGSSRGTGDEAFNAIVGIGASAGGVEALEALFRGLPDDPGMAFVVVTHLAPHHESLLTSIIGRYTAMPVTHAAEGDRVEANAVYVLPPDALLTIAGRRLHLHAPNVAHRERNPIDIFFAALAEDQGENAIGIVLSGSGSDGTLGIKAIKEKGGLTMAQGAKHSMPRHPGMPSSAIATGLVDLVLPVEEMPGRLLDYVRRFGEARALVDDNGSAHDIEQIARARGSVCAILRNQIGHDFTGYKENTLLRRVLRRMQVLQLTHIDGYVEVLNNTPDEAMMLFRDLLIGVTSFFRDADAFDILQNTVVPQLFAGKGASDLVRVWVPGCATGEEVYSLAIILREHMHTLRASPKVQVFATDIDDAAIEVARAGRYPAALMDNVSQDRLERFFVADRTSYVVAKDVRDLCIFASHSVIRDPPFSRIDLVSCRNLLIYLNAELQSRVIPMFHFALRPGGFLFLGISENVSQHGDLFLPLDKKKRIFQRRDHVRAPVHVPLAAHGLSPRALAAAGGAGDYGTSALSLRRSVEQRVLDRFAPAHVVVNRDGEVVYYSSRTGKYIEAAAGSPSRLILTMARKGLRLDLRSALQEAWEKRKVVTRDGIAIELDDRIQIVDLMIEPLPEQDNDPLFLVLFTDVGPMMSLDEAAARGRAVPDIDGTVERLHIELRETRERLQSIIEEYETALEELKSANEEMVSVNEEIQSTNEELETSKEELQSVNEELHSVNLTLAEKVDELDRANSDLRNVFESTRIATIFLDRALIIRSFTPAISDIFNLIPADCGRPLVDIVSQLDYGDLQVDVGRVLETGVAVERQVQRLDRRQGHYLMRVLPYHGSNHEIDGVLVTFVDVSAAVAAQAHLQTLLEELNHRVKNMLAVVTAMVAQTLKRNPSPERFASALLGRIQALASSYALISRHEWSEVGLGDVVETAMMPYHGNGDRRLTTDGPDLVLKPVAALALGLVLHELVTNAVKYGALSVDGGRVAIRWAIDAAHGPSAVVVRWTEAGGPAVAAPHGKGFGMELIERQLDYELGGTALIAYAPDGLIATLIIPVDPHGAAPGRAGPAGLAAG